MGGAAPAGTFWDWSLLRSLEVREELSGPGLYVGSPVPMPRSLRPHVGRRGRWLWLAVVAVAGVLVRWPPGREDPESSGDWLDICLCWAASSPSLSTGPCCCPAAATNVSPWRPQLPGCP